MIAKSPYAVIDRIILTEKSSRCMEKANQYVFKVSASANKLEVKKALEQLFNVHVIKVNTMNRKGKRKRERTMSYGRTAGMKRAVVTLKEGDKIEVV